jgi:hypothetical protein
MQAALDATALMLSKDAQNLSTEQLGSKAAAYFTALFNRPELSNAQEGRKDAGGLSDLSNTPFSVDVDVGAANVDASWIDVRTGRSRTAPASKSWYNSKNICTSKGGTWTPKAHSE